MTYRREPAPYDSWTAEQWEELRDRAAAYLATDPGWIVGPAVVAQAEGRIRALRAVSCPA